MPVPTSIQLKKTICCKLVAGQEVPEDCPPKSEWIKMNWTCELWTWLAIRNGPLRCQLLSWLTIKVSHWRCSEFAYFWSSTLSSLGGKCGPNPLFWWSGSSPEPRQCFSFRASQHWLDRQGLSGIERPRGRPLVCSRIMASQPTRPLTYPLSEIRVK